jgi:hypothetical protein
MNVNSKFYPIDVFLVRSIRVLTKVSSSRRPRRRFSGYSCAVLSAGSVLRAHFASKEDWRKFAWMNGIQAPSFADANHSNARANIFGSH